MWSATQVLPIFHEKESFEVSRTGSGEARILKLARHNPALDCFRIFECSIKVFRFFQIFIARAQSTFGWVWDLSGPPLATPLRMGIKLGRTSLVSYHPDIWLELLAGNHHQ